MIRPSRAQTPADVAAHYDELDPFYREVWGEHVHHGYWATGRESPEAAAEALVGLLARHLRLAPGLSVCDIGCGYGATARALARQHGVRVLGLTISPVQAARARAAAAPGVEVELRDWLANGLPEACFDRALAVESTEHMPDLARFFGEAARTLRPGGLLAVCAWLARPDPRRWEVRRLLEPICREGRLAGMGTLDEYRDLAARAGLVEEVTLDLSAQVRRTWSVCLRRVLARLATDARYRSFLADRRAANRVFALTLARLLLAYRLGAMRYALLVWRKSASAQ